MRDDFLTLDDLDDFNELDQHNDTDNDISDEEFKSIFGNLDLEDEDEPETVASLTSHYDMNKADCQPKQWYGGSVTDISLTIVQGRSKQGFSLGSIKVKLTTNGETPIDSKRFKCYIYTDDFYPMCYSDQGHYLRIQRQNVAVLTIECQQVWLPGKYFIMVYDTADAMTRYDFSIDEQMRLSALQWHDCLGLGDEDVLWNCLEYQPDGWRQLARYPGTAQLRRHAIWTIRLALYNKYRENRGHGAIKSSRNLLFHTRNKDIDYNVLRWFAHIVMPGYSLSWIDCSSLYDTTTMNPYEHLSEVVSEPSKRIFCLTNIGSLLSTGGKVIVRKMLEMKQENGDDSPLWICGTRQEVDGLFDMFPSLREQFLDTNRLCQEQYTVFDIVQSFISLLKEEHLEATDAVTGKLVKAIMTGYKRGLLSTWSLRDIRRYVEESVRPRYLERMLPLVYTNEKTTLLAEDLNLPQFADKVSSYEESIKALQEMVGLDNIKESLLTMANNTRFAARRRKRGLTTSTNATYHAIFTGNPGTGKTTVARLLGRIYHSLGLLSKGEVIAADRTRLVGRYIGETEENMKAVLEEARGNVLFIDEAYNLYDGANDRKDYGNKVIDSLLTVLSQPDPDLLVIFAGYTKEMDAMLNTNPGLMGRFPYKFNFSDYTAPQLTEIANRLLKHDEYVLTDDAQAVLQEAIAQTVAHPTENFGNARWVEQFVKNGIIPAMANRVLSTSSDDYQHIEASDVKKAYEQFNPQKTVLKPRRKVGFSR